MLALKRNLTHPSYRDWATSKFYLTDYGQEGLGVFFKHYQMQNNCTEKNLTNL